MASMGSQPPSSPLFILQVWHPFSDVSAQSLPLFLFPSYSLSIDDLQVIFAPTLSTPYIQPKLFTSTGNWYHTGSLMMSLGYLINMPQINILIFPLLCILPTPSPRKMSSNFSPLQ
jgi:hypothetical protein